VVLSSKCKAPEVSCGVRYDEKADVFSFGMVMTELITRKKPALRTPAKGYRFQVDAFKKIVPPDCPPEMVEIAICCAEQEPEKRPAFRDILPKLKDLVSKLEAQERARLEAAAKVAASSSATKEDANKDKTKSEKKHKKKVAGAPGEKHKKKKKERDPNETPEERAKRREERRKRREERAKRKEQKEKQSTTAGAATPPTSTAVAGAVAKPTSA